MYRGAFDDMIGTGTYFTGARSPEIGIDILAARAAHRQFPGLRAHRASGRPAISKSAITPPCRACSGIFRTGRQHKIVWDPKSERITNYEPANELLTRRYRAPWSLAGLEA